MGADGYILWKQWMLRLEKAALPAFLYIDFGFSLAMLNFFLHQAASAKAILTEAENWGNNFVFNRNLILPF